MCPNCSITLLSLGYDGAHYCNGNCYRKFVSKGASLNLAIKILQSMKKIYRALGRANSQINALVNSHKTVSQQMVRGSLFILDIYT